MVSEIASIDYAAGVMAGKNMPALVALRARREAVIGELSSHFANDVLDIDEFEQRVDLAHRATSTAELDKLVAGLQEPTKALVLQPGTSRAVARRARKANRALTVLWGTQRTGRWRVPKNMRVVTVMGGIDLDFREAEFGPGVTEVKVTCVMGGIAIIVPPHLAVECDGAAFLGGFEGMERMADEPDPDAPLLRITGLAVVGAVEICTRAPGETMKADPDAHFGQIGRR